MEQLKTEGMNNSSSPSALSPEEKKSGVIFNRENFRWKAYSRGVYLGEYDTEEDAQMNVNAYFSHTNP